MFCLFYFVIAVAFFWKIFQVFVVLWIENPIHVNLFFVGNYEKKIQVFPGVSEILSLFNILLQTAKHSKYKNKHKIRSYVIQNVIYINGMT